MEATSAGSRMGTSGDEFVLDDSREFTGEPEAVAKTLDRYSLPMIPSIGLLLLVQTQGTLPKGSGIPAPGSQPTQGTLEKPTSSRLTAPPRIMRIDPKSKDWRPAATTAAALAAKADRALQQASRISAEWKSLIFLPEGTGSANGKYAIFTPSAWKLESLNATGGAKELTRTIFVSNGTKWTQSAAGKWKPRQAISTWQSARTTIPLARWGTWYPLGITQAVGSRRAVFSDLVKGSSMRGTRWQAQVRNAMLNGQKFTSYRIVGTGGSVGPAQVEVVFESLKFMPVTIRTMSGSGKKTTSMFFTYRWNLSPTQSFNPNDFVLPTN